MLESIRSAPPKYFPIEFLAGLAEMPCLFKAIGQDLGFPTMYAERIAELIPREIRDRPCFLDRLTGIWRYEYGKPLTLRTGARIVGAPMFPEVGRLFDVLGCGEWRLTGENLQTYLTRLTDLGRHEDVLAEFAPILRLADTAAVEHEVRGSEDNLTTVDWRIETPGLPTLLLEVKNRIGDLIESFEAIRNLNSNDVMPPPEHDHAMLFKSVERKFMPRRPEETIQGVWVKVGLMQEEEKFRSAFGALDLDRVHAAVLGDWGEDGYVVAVDGATKKSVLKILRLKQSKRLVFNR